MKSFSRNFVKWKSEVHEHLEELMARKVVLENKINSSRGSYEEKARLDHIEKMIELNKFMIMIYLDDPLTPTLH